MRDIPDACGCSGCTFGKETAVFTSAEVKFGGAANFSESAVSRTRLFKSIVVHQMPVIANNRQATHHRFHSYIAQGSPKTSSMGSAPTPGPSGAKIRPFFTTGGFLTVSFFSPLGLITDRMQRSGVEWPIWATTAQASSL